MWPIPEIISRSSRLWSVPLALKFPIGNDVFERKNINFEWATWAWKIRLIFQLIKESGNRYDPLSDGIIPSIRLRQQIQYPTPTCKGRNKNIFNLFMWVRDIIFICISRKVGFLSRYCAFWKNSSGKFPQLSRNDVVLSKERNKMPRASG